MATRTNTAYAWYFTDHLGSVRMQLDHSGTPNPAMTYDAFGNPIAALESPFGFTGELHAADTGLVHDPYMGAPARAGIPLLLAR